MYICMFSYYRVGFHMIVFKFIGIIIHKEDNENALLQCQKCDYNAKGA